MSFDEHFHRDAEPKPQKQDLTILKNVESIAPGITDFLATHAGLSYEKGLYRLFHVAEIPKWISIVSEAMPEVKGKVFCFGYDWLGRIFAISLQKRENDEFHIVMLEPGSGDVLYIPTTFMNFHNREMIEYIEDALAKSFHQGWLDAGGAIPQFHECAGYETPLFLGGEDDSSNLEIIDMEVYWVITGQLLVQTRDLPEGTQIGNVDFEEDE